MFETSELYRLLASFGLVLLGITACYHAARHLIPKTPHSGEQPFPCPKASQFVFHGDTLVDASPSAATLLAKATDAESDRAALLHILSPQFPDLDTQLDALRTDKPVTLVNCGLQLVMREDDGLIRVTLSAMDNAESPEPDSSHATMPDSELNLLKCIARHTPQLIWREGPQGQLTWANAAYLSYADQSAPDQNRSGQIWPSARLFAELQPPPPDTPRAVRGRHSLHLPGEDAEHWFDIVAVPQDTSVLFFATDANATVRAERAQQDFQQTLGKTFGQLSTGLAIFNKKRQLTMFNPALLDMTGLPFEFLSARPGLDAVLDRLREARKLPEPKNYTTWREKFSALEAAAKDGTYAERWDLPDGQVFRVTGRPHPDGALQFLFEDISAEVSLTRRFRAEIEMGQAVMNALTDAIAVFSSSSTLIMKNAAYDNLWAGGDDSQMQIHDLRGALRLWKAQSVPSVLWRDIEEFGRLRQERPRVSHRLLLQNGRRMICLVDAISGGMTLVRFSPCADQFGPGVPLITSLPESRAAIG